MKKRKKLKKRKRKARKNKMIKIDAYFKYSDLDDTYYPHKKLVMIDFLKNSLDVASLDGFQLPSDLASKSTIYNQLLSLVMGRYHEHAIIKLDMCVISEITEEAKAEAYLKWVYKFMALLNDTHAYYITMLDNYASAQTHLMDDIKATSKNKVKFNDTPQNANLLGVYEGDDYITHFTSTEGETSSELMSKINRLKEIQDNYKDMMSIWVRDFERIFYQEEC